MTVVSWNVENLLRCMAELPRIIEQFRTPEVVCLQELRIRAQDEPAVLALERALPGYRCHYALPRDPRNVTFRGGRMYGVATFVRDRWRAHVPPWDREGRVVVVRRRGLAVVNVYAVNGTAKPYFDETGRVAGDRERAYTWFNRRSRTLDAARVDYILVSEDLVPRVAGADILEPLPWSDHAPVRLDLAPA